MGQALGAAAMLSIATPVPVRAESFKAEYVVTLFGLTIARTSFTSTLDADSYAVDGTISSSGLGAIFDDTKGVVHTSGRLRKNEPQPTTHMLDYSSGKKKQRTTVRFENGQVVATENVPPPKPRRHGWVPLGAGDLTDVVDPLTATLVRAASLDEVCNRTVHIYDGELRADLTLTYASKAPVTVGDFKGESVTCTVRFKPISGYRKGSKTMEYLSAGHDMSVTFARMGDTSFFVPLRGEVETRIGTVYFRVGKIG
ncbi:DUF3108 domain-containing protein [Tianweitania sp. BSSL-BM11]|uniref:DUF3108 domain-containing protein n=1 Tax=Tianweitania aestuarii TaxID=2814886 RepID=A0ABS5RZQ2_9HYPH|nr:DUF3108 domain-containing protein [Tianweitania aestuarii]MBS9722501.1 DUF3108 domain-containing protein [Tianweitania aestuarii]